VAYPKSNLNLYCNNEKWLEFYNDAVFIAPKTYALKNKNEEIIKIKGINYKNISFENIKKDFYNNSSITFNNQLNFERKEFTLRQNYINKKITLSSYDKRIFINNKKSTIPKSF
jgi:hypothetical protein